MKSDAEFMLWCLEQGPHTTMEIINRSYAERRCGLTPHTRASTLRQQGHDIRCRRIGSERHRPVYRYTLVREPEQLELIA